MVTKIVFKYWVGTTSNEIRLCAIFLERNPSYHSKTKHIDVQYHFVRDMVGKKEVLLEKVDTLKNVADSLTRSTSTEKFSLCRVTMGTVALDY
jgi:hypothetical protein